MAASYKRTRSKTKGGRPRKKSVKAVNRGRKRIPVKVASISTKKRRASALALSVDYDVSLLELALQIAKKRQGIDKKIVLHDKSEKNDRFERHDNDSALGFFMEYGYTKHGYNGLVSDSRSRGCSIYIITLKNLKENVA